VSIIRDNFHRIKSLFCAPGGNFHCTKSLFCDFNSLTNVARNRINPRASCSCSSCGTSYTIPQLKELALEIWDHGRVTSLHSENFRGIPQPLSNVQGTVYDDLVCFEILIKLLDKCGSHQSLIRN